MISVQPSPGVTVAQETDAERSGRSRAATSSARRPEMRRARHELAELDRGPGPGERLGQPDALGQRHEVVRGPVHQQDGRRGGAGVGHRAGLRGQIRDGPRAGRRGTAPLGTPARDQRPPTCATSSSRPARSVTGNQATTPCTPEPGPSDPFARLRSARPSARGVPPAGVAPGKHASRVHPVLGGVLPDPADRGADVVQGRRETRLAAEPIVDRRHRETPGGEPRRRKPAPSRGRGTRRDPRRHPPPCTWTMTGTRPRSASGRYRSRLERPVPGHLAVHEVGHPPDRRLSCGGELVGPLVEHPRSA